MGPTPGVVHVTGREFGDNLVAPFAVKLPGTWSGIAKDGTPATSGEVKPVFTSSSGLELTLDMVLGKAGLPPERAFPYKLDKEIAKAEVESNKAKDATSGYSLLSVPSSQGKFLYFDQTDPFAGPVVRFTYWTDSVIATGKLKCGEHPTRECVEVAHRLVSSIDPDE